jgi:hypothetical protein
MQKELGSSYSIAIKLIYILERYPVAVTMVKLLSGTNFSVAIWHR